MKEKSKKTIFNLALIPLILVIINFKLLSKPKFAQRINNIKFSATLKLADKIKQLESNGEKIIKLGIGQPHLPTPENIKLAAINAIEQNKTNYSHSRGIEPLRKAIIDKYNKQYKTNLNENKNILITPGAKQAILYIFLALLNPGDEVIIPTPCWVSYAEIIKIAGGIPVFIDSDPNRNFQTPIQKIKQTVTAKTKAIILNNPNNPTSQIIEKQDLNAINQFCIQKNIYLIMDEIYDQIIFDGFKNYSIAGINKKFKNCILINGFSKAYSMTGWRLGYVISNQQIISALLKVQQNSITNPTTFAQFGAIEAITNGHDFTKKLLSDCQENRNFLISKFKNFKNFKLITPQGGFYTFIDVSKINPDSNKFCMELLEKHKITVLPGIIFGKSGEGFIRINMATEKENIRNFVNCLKKNYEE